MFVLAWICVFASSAVLATTELTIPTLSPPEELPIPFCEGLSDDPDRKVDIVFLTDTDGRYRNRNGLPRDTQCYNYFYSVADVMRKVKEEEPSGTGLPQSRAAYIEFNRQAILNLVALDNGEYNTLPVAAESLIDYSALIAGRCGDLYPADFFENSTYDDAFDCDANDPTKLYEALTAARDTLEENQVEGRDRYIVIFMNCLLPQAEQVRICDEFADYIRTGVPDAQRGDNALDRGINVAVIGMGGDGPFAVNGQDTDNDYLSCLVEYDSDRVWTADSRDPDYFKDAGLAAIVGTICDREPTPAPTTDPTRDPTKEPTDPTESPTACESGGRVKISLNGGATFVDITNRGLGGLLEGAPPDAVIRVVCSNLNSATDVGGLEFDLAYKGTFSEARGARAMSNPYEAVLSDEPAFVVKMDSPWTMAVGALLAVSMIVNLVFLLCNVCSNKKTHKPVKYASESEYV